MGKKAKSPAKKGGALNLPGRQEADQLLLVAAEKGFVKLGEISINLKWSTDQALRAPEHIQKMVFPTRCDVP